MKQYSANKQEYSMRPTEKNKNKQQTRINLKINPNHIFKQGNKSCGNE